MSECFCVFCIWVPLAPFLTEQSNQMDPAEQPTALGAQGILLGRHEQAIQILLDNSGPACTVPDKISPMNPIKEELSSLGRVWNPMKVNI